MKTVVICLHGLIKDADHDFIAFEKFVKENNIDIEVNLLRLYDISNKKTFVMEHKLDLVDNLISDYESKNYRIVLIGYSFSTGLAALMCKTHKIYKVILVSPVLHILHEGGVKYFLKMTKKSFKIRAKAQFNKKRKESLKKKNSLYIFDLIMSCFYQLHKTNKCYKYLNCPTLVMLGRDDLIILPKYLRDIRKLASQVEDYEQRFYQGADHVFIMSTLINKDPYYQDIVNFINE